MPHASANNPRFETELARRIARDVRGAGYGGRIGGERRTFVPMIALLLVASFALPLMSGSVSATDTTPVSGTDSGQQGATATGGLGSETIPATLPPSETTYSYTPGSPTDLSLSTGTGTTGTASPLMMLAPTSGHGGSGGDRLGNAPESHYRNLQKFLAKGKAPPPNYPVPYVIYTNSGGVELWTDAFTKQPVSIDVDNNAATGQGHKDVRVKTVIDVSPLVMTTSVERLGSPNPADLIISVTFPAFFYNGETGEPEGDPYWEYGYQTQPSQGIPADITMNFTADHSVGTTHTFKFAWTSSAGIPHLGFEYGVFQVVDQNTASPINPAFASFVVSSPSIASLTFTTAETATSSSKCMNWAAISAFALSFGYDELRSVLGLDFPMTVTVNNVPSAFSICTTEDRALHTYTLDYTASANVAYVNMNTAIYPTPTAQVTIDLTIRNMPSSLHAVLGDGSLGVTVSSPVGMVALNASALLGLAEVPSAINFRMIIVDLPSFSATWGQDATSNHFSLDTVSGCIGRIELAFSYSDVVLPAVHTLVPTAHYLSLYSDAARTTIALRLIGVQHIGFSQDNNVGSNTLTLGMCGNNVLYILVHSTNDGMLTPGTDIDLTVVMTSAPTLLSLTWTVPYVASITTNELIGSIVADLTYTQAPSVALVAHAEILSLPATTMSWNIAPSGSISFTAGSPIGEIILTATDPNGLLGAGTALGGQPIRVINLDAHSVPTFTASWSSSGGAPPMTAISFVTAPSTALGDLEFAATDSLTGYVVLLGPQANRAVLYSDDKSTASFKTSLWLHVEDVNRAQVSWGGTETTVTVGFGTAVSHALYVAAQIDPASNLNPVPGRGVTASLVTTPLPTSMDLTVRPASMFTYTASGVIGQVTLDLTLGETLPNIDVIHGEIHGIPTGSSGAWTTGTFSLTLASRLDRILVTLDNDAGVLGSSLKHILVDVHDIPESVSAAWNTGTNVATLSFTDSTYDEGLGEFKLLATTGDVGPTNAYITGLGTGSSCMTDYGTFTQHIDSGYWPSTVPGRLTPLYCRQPTLSTGSDDYGVYRTGTFDVYALRVRELGLLDLDLNEDAGHVTVEFSRNIALARELYFISDNTGSDEMVLGEVSRLPDGLAANTFHAEWNQATGHYAYSMSETIPFIDAYVGPHATTSQTNSFTKILLKDVPASVLFEYVFGDRVGHADFTASSTWEGGFLIQDGGTRYVGWLRLQSLHFDYSFALPGEESCTLGFDVEVCYRVFRLDTKLEAISALADGILGIYTRGTGLDALADSTPARAGGEYIPEWTFILDNFHLMEIHVLWDVGAGISVHLDLPPTVDIGVNLLPAIVVVADLSLVVDFWWNDNFHAGDTITIPLPLLPLPCNFTDVTYSFTINPVKDYVDQSPIHLWPTAGDPPVTFSLTGPSLTDGPSLDDPCQNYVFTVTLVIDVPGFHRSGNHPTPF